MSIDNDWGDRIAHQAQQWAGKEFAPGVREQCMNFVRKVLEQVHHPYAAQVTKEPVDKHWTGVSLASSLAGRDLGQMVTKIGALEPGDILFWNDTYDVGREYGPNTITHVGIALGPDRFIHRNTMSAPVNVQPYAGFWREHFRAGMRVPQAIKADNTVKAPPEAATFKLWANTNGTTLALRQPLDRGRYSLFSTGSASDGAWLVKVVDRGEGPSPANDTNRIWFNQNGATLDLRQDLDPGSYQVISSGSEAGGAMLNKLLRK